jgi:hypothetical protein
MNKEKLEGPITLFELKEHLGKPISESVDNVAKVTTDGTSLVIRIPSKICKKFSIVPGDYARFSVESAILKTESNITVNDLNIKITKDVDPMFVRQKNKNARMADFEKKILRVFLDAPDKSLSTNEIKMKAKLSWITTLRYLKRLGGRKILKLESKGQDRLYERNEKPVQAKHEMLWRLNLDLQMPLNIFK